MNSYLVNSKGLKVTAVYGGFSIVRQISEIKRGTNIVVGTPGRVKDLVNRKALNLNLVKYLVLDEADEMLDMGFKEDLDAILSEMPDTKQTLLFSATMPDSVRRIANLYMKQPVEIRTGSENKGAENVSHEYYVVQARDRYEVLRRILDSLPDVYGILFCRTRRETQEVASKLVRDHYKAGAIHGDIAQAQRTQIMNSFRRKQIKLLVATDVAARGIDVKGLTHILNYNLPDTDEIYIHRSGRTGRAESKGVSISIINTREKRRIRDIERKVQKEFEKRMVPTGKDICANQLFTIIEKITKTEVDEAQIKGYLPGIYKKISHLDKEALIKHVVSMEFNYFLNLYKNARDLNADDNRLSDFNHSTRKANDFATFKINYGRQDKVTVKDLLTLINSKDKMRGVEIGRIQLEQTISYFEIDIKVADQVLALFNKSNFKNRPIRLEKVTVMPQLAKRDYSRRDSGRQHDRAGRRGYLGRKYSGKKRR